MNTKGKTFIVDFSFSRGILDDLDKKDSQFTSVVILECLKVKSEIRVKASIGEIQMSESLSLATLLNSKKRNSL